MALNAVSSSCARPLDSLSGDKRRREEMAKSGGVNAALDNSKALSFSDHKHVKGHFMAISWPFHGYYMAMTCYDQPVS